MTWPKCILLFHKKKSLGFCTKIHCSLDSNSNQLVLLLQLLPFDTERTPRTSCPPYPTIPGHGVSSTEPPGRQVVIHPRNPPQTRGFFFLLSIYVSPYSLYISLHSRPFISLTCFLILFVNFTIRLFVCHFIKQYFLFYLISLLIALFLCLPI